MAERESGNWESKIEISPSIAFVHHHRIVDCKWGHILKGRTKGSSERTRSPFDNGGHKKYVSHSSERTQKSFAALLIFCGKRIPPKETIQLRAANDGGEARKEGKKEGGSVQNAH